MLACSTEGLRPVKIVRRAGDSTAGRVSQDVGVNHRGLDVFVSEQLLDRPDVMSGHEEVGREAVAECVRADLLGDVRFPCGTSDGSLNHRFVEVVPPDDTGARVGAAGAGREDVLPLPFAVGVGVLTGQSVGQVDAAVAVGQVLLVEGTNFAQVILQAVAGGVGEHGRPVPSALGAANADVPEVG